MKKGYAIGFIIKNTHKIKDLQIDAFSGCVNTLRKINDIGKGLFYHIPIGTTEAGTFKKPNKKELKCPGVVELGISGNLQLYPLWIKRKLV